MVGFFRGTCGCFFHDSWPFLAPLNGGGCPARYSCRMFVPSLSLAVAAHCFKTFTFALWT